MKSERSEIKFKLEDNQLDVKCSIDDMVVSKSLLYHIATIDRLQRNHNKLENKKKELKQKLFEKMEVCCMLLS